MSQASATATDDQFAARELVRSWAAGSNAVAAARDVEQGDPDAWRTAYAGLAQLGIFGVALPEECGGAGGTVDDLCAMVDEAAAALVPGPVATTAVATLVVPSSHAELLEALASGERTAGLALNAELHCDGGRHRAPPSSCWAPKPVGCCCCPRAITLFSSTPPPTGSPSNR